jgi:hypothetical protein
VCLFLELASASIECNFLPGAILLKQQTNFMMSTLATFPQRADPHSADLGPQKTKTINSSGAWGAICRIPFYFLSFIRCYLRKKNDPFSCLPGRVQERERTRPARDSTAETLSLSADRRFVSVHHIPHSARPVHYNSIKQSPLSLLSNSRHRRLFSPLYTQPFFFPLRVMIIK